MWSKSVELFNPYDALIEAKNNKSTELLKGDCGTMYNFREKFTSWYYSKGYRMEYRPREDGVAELVFRCPFWVRPLVFIFFSPCAYYREAGYEL